MMNNGFRTQFKEFEREMSEDDLDIWKLALCMSLYVVHVIRYCLESKISEDDYNT